MDSGGLPGLYSAGTGKRTKNNVSVVGALVTMEADALHWIESDTQ